MPEILITPAPAEFDPDTVDREFRELTVSLELGDISVDRPQGWAELQSDELGGVMRDGDIDGDGRPNNQGREEGDPRFEDNPNEGQIIDPDTLPGS